MRIRMVFDLKDFGGNDLVYEPSLVNGDPVKFGQTGVIARLPVTIHIINGGVRMRCLEGFMTR